ncbi:MAG: NAD-dependent epimerase/dehydratase family protein, partial [Gemmatimonadota bacterium]|nr:NAD-dependent epimerase/dehydratase family protein [Gemmatimonadota bacterium]
MQRDRPRRDRPVALVTGGAGFIGAHLLRELQEMDRSDLVALDDLSGGFRDHVPDGVPFVEGSITDSALVDALFDEHAFDHV